MGDHQGVVLRQFRLRAGLTQEALAEQSGVSVRTIRGLETGTRRNPRRTSLRQLADALGLELHERDKLAGLGSAEAPSSTCPEPRQLPPPSAGFAGRDAELAELDRADGGTVYVVAGPGGIGKTSLVVHWAHRHADRFPDGQLFADLHGFSSDADRVEPLSAVRGFLDALGVDPAGISGGLAEHVARYRSRVAGKRMLIVLDNAATADQVIPLLPGTPACPVLVTSRNTLIALLHRHGALHLPLSVLAENEAYALLARRLGEPRLAAEPDAVADLIRLCGRYPLALGIVASRAHANPRIPLAEFAEELDESVLDALDNNDSAASLPAVLSLSLRALTDEQRTTFALLGIAPGRDIGLPAAASLTGLPIRDVTRVLRELAERALLDRRAYGRYSMHDLIRDHAARQPLEADMHEDALRRVLDFYVHTAHAGARRLNRHSEPLSLGSPVPGVQRSAFADDAAAIAWFDAEHVNLLAAQHIAVAQAWHTMTWQLAWVLTAYHSRRGHLHDEIRVWAAAQDAALHLPDAGIRSAVQRHLGRAYDLLGHRDEAIRHLRQALAWAEQDRDFSEQAEAHQALSWAWGIADTDRAQHHARHAIAAARALDKPNWEAQALSTGAWLCVLQRDYESAREHCQASLALYRAQDDPTDVAGMLHALGFIESETGNHSLAVRHYDEAAVLYHSLGHRYLLADTLERIGNPCLVLGQAERAATAWREAVELYRQQGRDEDADRVRQQLEALDPSWKS